MEQLGNIPQNRKLDEMMERLKPPLGRDPQRDVIRTARVLHELHGHPTDLSHRLGLGKSNEGWQYACRLLDEAVLYITVALDVLAQDRMAYMLTAQENQAEKANDIKRV